MSLLQPLLDNQVWKLSISFPLLTNYHQVGLKNMEGVDKAPMSVEKVNLLKLYHDL